MEQDEIGEEEGIPLRVLVIDDQRSMRRIIRSLLGKIGITDISEANDGSSALELLDKPLFKTPDVIICDLHMNGMDGLDFCNKLRRSKNSAKNGIPILMLTGEQDDFLLDVVRQVGAASVIQKPVSAETLNERIQNIIGYAETA